MKSDRLMSALLLLQAHGRLSTREIAERLEISQRTAHRDMESLCMAGVPLIAHRGVQGGWELEKGWRTRVPGLDEAELQSLLMLQPSGLGHAKLTAAAQRAYEKLVASLPGPMRARANSIRARLHIDASGWRGTGEDLSTLPLAQEAVARDRKLSFHYTRADGEGSSRTVDPLGLVCKQTVWYLIAQTPQGMRTYRVARMREAVVLALPAKRPARFDLAKYWKQSTEQLQDARKPFRATLALSPSAVQTLSPWMQMAPAGTKAARLPKEWDAFELDFESREQAQFVALGLGSRARVLAPTELTALVSAELKQIGRLEQSLIR